MQLQTAHTLLLYALYLCAVGAHPWTTHTSLLVKRKPCTPGEIGDWVSVDPSVSCMVNADCGSSEIKYLRSARVLRSAYLGCKFYVEIQISVGESYRFGFTKDIDC